MLLSCHQSTRPKTAPEEALYPRTGQSSLGRDFTPSACNRDTWLKLTEELVQFPKTPDLIVSCQEAVYCFGVMLHNAFDTPIARWKAEGQAQSISLADVEVIQEAHDFAVLSSSLFKCLAEEIPCKRTHWADIHLSGFSGGQMNTSVRTCHGIRNISTCFSKFVHSFSLFAL